VSGISPNPDVPKQIGVTMRSVRPSRTLLIPSVIAPLSPMAGFFVTPTPNRQIAFRVAYDGVVEKQRVSLKARA
jgi:hypothetical protein